MRELLTRPPPRGIGQACVRRYLDWRRWLRLLFRAEPAAVASLLRDATTATLARCLRSPAQFDPVKLERIVERLVVLSGLRGAAFGFEIPPLKLSIAADPEGWPCTPLGLVLQAPAELRTLSFEPGQVGLDLANDQRLTLALSPPEPASPGWVQARFPHIRGGTCLGLQDLNPLALDEAHPDKHGNALDLGDASPSEWCRALNASLEQIHRTLPELGREFDDLIQLIHPVGTDAERHLSASYQEAIGVIYLSLHPNQLTMSEALIHEFSHNKLAMLFELDPLLHNAESQRFLSPLRPDPRPLRGVLLAVHAFLPVARFYEKLLRSSQEPPCGGAVKKNWNRFAEIRDGNHQGLTLLKQAGEWTSAGKALLSEMIRWDDHFCALQAPQAPD